MRVAWILLLTVMMVLCTSQVSAKTLVTNSALVNSADPDKNYGNYWALYVDNPRESYIELPLYNQSIILYLCVYLYSDKIDVDVMETSEFDEDTITWNNRPPEGDTLTSLTITDTDTWVSVEIPDAPRYIVLNSTSTDIAIFYSDDEAGYEPYVEPAQFTSWENNITNNTDLYLTTRRPVHFNATMNTDPVWWNWSVDNTPQNHNYDNITIDFHETGVHYVELEARGKTLTWRVVRLGDLGESISNVSEEHYTSLLDVFQENRSIEGAVEGSTHPYRDAIGDLFFVFLWGIIIIMITIRHQSTLIPSVITLMLSAIMIVTLPAEWQRTATGLLVISIAGVLYSLFKSRG